MQCIATKKQAMSTNESNSTPILLRDKENRNFEKQKIQWICLLQKQQQNKEAYKQTWIPRYSNIYSFHLNLYSHKAKALNIMRKEKRNQSFKFQLL